MLCLYLILYLLVLFAFVDVLNIVSHSKKLFRNVQPNCKLLQCYQGKLSNIEYALLLSLDMDRISLHLSEYKLEIYGELKYNNNVIKSLLHVLNSDKVKLHGCV